MARNKTPTEEPKPSDVEETPVDAPHEATPAPDEVDDAEPVESANGELSDGDDAAEVETDGPDDEAAPIETDTTIDEPSAPQQVTVRKGGTVPMLIGGALCAAIGFGAAQFIKPEGWPFPGANTDELSARIDSLSASVADVDAKTEMLRGDLETARASFADQIDTAVEGIDLDAQIAPLSEKLADFEQRMTALEARPVAEAIVSPEATAAYERQLSEMRNLLDSEIARLEAAQTAAQEQEAQANAVTAFADLKTAVDSGEPFEALIADLEIDVPQALTDAAADGVAGIAELQDRFPQAARAALTAASKAAYEAGEEGWFSTFTRTQLGLRSLSPKEGDDVDAVLSRAEADVREADFAGALTTLDVLPEAAREALVVWITDASERVAVTNALAELSRN